MRTVTYSRDATRTLVRLPVNVAAKIKFKIEQYATDPAAQANNVKAIKGQAGYARLRVGDWRVIFTEDARVVAILKVAPRGSAYD